MTSESTIADIPIGTRLVVLKCRRSVTWLRVPRITSR
jgi:hypothetical protein